MSSNVTFYITVLLYSLPGLIIGFTVHELAHALVAVRLGDPTPRNQGRITLDPRQHIDPLGFGMLLLVGFGWAKPVQFSPAYIRTPLQQAAVAAAGPLSNLVLAALFGVALHIELATGVDTPTDVPAFGHGGPALIVYFLLGQAFFINVILFVFNSIPIPGLDGFMIARGLFGRLLPDLFSWMERNAQIVIVVAIALVFLVPQVTGGPGPLGSLIVDVNDRLYHAFVAGDAPVTLGLPSIRYLFS